jgi:hypothetical protein
MPMLELSDEQVIELVTQLSPEKQEELVRRLLLRRWSNWEALSNYGQARVRELASQRGLNWDTMSEAEREAFIDDLVHEDRGCAQ